jgi:hypothetical protein
VVFTRQYPSPPPSEPHKYDDYWGFTTPRVLSIDPAPAQPAQPSQQNWARWFTTTDWFHGDIVFQEPLLGSNLTITKFLVDPPQLRLRHANYFTITLTNIGPVTASRWFYNELYIRAISDSAPTGPYDHVWGLIKFQGDALFRKPEDNDYQIHSLGPSESITMYTVITVTGIMTGNTSYKAYAQTDTAYQGDVYHYYWFGANAEGNGIPPYPEEKNVATLLNTLYISATYLLEAPEIVTQTASPGFSTIHSVPVNNVGNMSDTYTITRVYHGWITSVPSPFGPVNNAAVKNLPVTVAIPAGTPLGAMDTATVTITSRGDPSQIETVIVKTIAGRIYLPIVMKK